MFRGSKKKNDCNDIEKMKDFKISGKNMYWMIGVVILVLVIMGMRCQNSELFEMLLPGDTKRPPTMDGERPMASQTTDPLSKNQKMEMYKRDASKCEDEFLSGNLLPKKNDVLDDSAFEFAPKDLQNINFLDATTRIGVDTVSSSLRNANYSIRSEPPNPRDVVSPWMNTTIDPDLERKSLEV